MARFVSLRPSSVHPVRCPCGQLGNPWTELQDECWPASTPCMLLCTNDIVKRALAAADIPSTPEPVGLCRSDGKRADGVTMIPWKRDQSLARDVTCSDTFAPSYISCAASGAARIANMISMAEVKVYFGHDQ